MKLIRTKNFEGFEIVDLVSDPTLDPERTRKQALGEVHSNKESLAFMEAYQRYKEALEKKRYEVAKQILKNELTKLAKKMNDRIRDVASFNPVYCHHGETEFSVTDEQAEMYIHKLQTLGKNEYLLKTGRVLRDERGRVWFDKDQLTQHWKKGAITRVGESKPAGSLWADELTKEQWSDIWEQDEHDRISALSRELKLEEMNRAIALAMKRAAEHRSELEIMGDERALEKARKYFEDVERLLKEKYGEG
jgi:hypothetical protein